MKKDEIEALGYGREMDLLLAEHVFGWTEEDLRLVQVPSSLEEALEWGWEKSGGDDYDWRRAFRVGTFEDGVTMQTPEGWDFYALPKWSVNIFLAWNVLESLPLPRSIHERHSEGVMEGSKFMCQAGDKLKWREKQNWDNGSVDTESYVVTYRGFGETAQLAICRAALIYSLEEENE